MLKLDEINSIVKLKADVPLYYLNNYTGTAHFIDESAKEMSIPVSFSLEMEPTGHKKVELKIEDEVDYPLLPLIKMLKEEVTRLDKEGKLPW